MLAAQTTCEIDYDYVIQAGDDVATGSEDGAGIGTCSDAIDNGPDTFTDTDDTDCDADGIVDNEVSVESNPLDFTNNIDASDSAAVELFVPEISVTKTEPQPKVGLLA